MCLKEPAIICWRRRLYCWLPDGNPKGIESFADLGTDKLSLLALGNEDVPVGQYSEEILTNLGMLDQLEQENKITYGSNVKEVTTQVSEAAADARYYLCHGCIFSRPSGGGSGRRYHVQAGDISGSSSEYF